MSETKNDNEIIEVGDNILNRVLLEHQKYIRYKAYTRLDVLSKNSNEKGVFWLVERTGADISYKRDFLNNPTTVISEHSKTNTLNDKSFGFEVSKNTPLGVMLDKYEFGNEETPVPKNLKSIYSKAHYIAHNFDAKNGEISFSDLRMITFSSLKEELESIKKQINEKEEKLKELQEAENKEAENRIKEELRKLRAEEKLLEEERRKRKRHIIDSQTLRLQPKLEGEQIDIKSKSIFNNEILIIDGGPGTGKTTTLIDRINFLTDKAIIEFVNDLDDSDYNVITNPMNAYVLFTPNELLLHYLEQAMNSKGLSANKERVRIWDNYKYEVLNEQGFGFLKADKKVSPFVQYRKTLDRLFDLTVDNIGDFTQLIQTSVIEFLFKRHTRLISMNEMDFSKFAYKEIALKISVELNFVIKSKQIKDWVNFYIKTTKYRTEHKENNETLNSILTKSAETLLAKLKTKQKELYDQVEAEILKSLSQQNKAEEEEVEEDDIVDNNVRDTLKVLNRLKNFIRNKASISLDKNAKLNTLDKFLEEKVGAFVDTSYFQEIASRRLFQKYFAQIISGPENNILKTLPTFYKFFRKEYLNKEYSHFVSKEHRKLFEEIVLGQKKKDEDKPKNVNNRIVSEEVDVLIFLVLRMVREIYSANKNYYNTTSNTFVQYYKLISRHIVAIDEATDFTAIQLACMSMLSNPKFNCVTLSGDLMQRMTTTGIQKWEEYTAITNDVRHEVLSRCYRQSYRLLDLTKMIYKQSTSIEPTFFSNYEYSDNDPHPLCIQSKDICDKVDWLAEQIIDIRDNYEESKVTPTIAVFVSDDNEVDLLAQKLYEHDDLSNINIEACKDGKVLGAGSNVRIFNVKYIKGLEFEAVIFYDIDKIEQKYPSILDKILYVGLSRASLYLGVTIENQFPASLKYLEKEFKTTDEFDWKK